MPQQIASGLFAGRSGPDATFIWSVEEVEACNELRVKVSYGGGMATDNLAEAHIPWGSKGAWPLVPDPNPSIKVEGSVTALWGTTVDQTTKKPLSFVLTFSGNMTLYLAPPTAVTSSDKYSGLPQKPIIVYAHLG